MWGCDESTAMNPLIYIAAAVVWYGICEWERSRIRSKSNLPSIATFWIGLMQRFGVFALI
jgi:hypothetical protein